MIAFISNIAPILLGFLGKLIALKSQAASENQKLMIESMQARNDSINQARAWADKESPMAAWNRRIIILVILGLIIFTQVAPVWFNIPTAIPIVHKGFSILGINLTQDVIEYQVVNGLIKYDEIFAWASMIIEFYFGAQLAKGK
tara:strand:+ start:1311 stop:1742 length:432 start_codon:yes stop_codon:yes gene_type:complete